MPWYRSVSYKLSSLLYKNVGAFINIHRDISSENNRVVIDSEGNPVVNYEVSVLKRYSLICVYTSLSFYCRL